MIYISTLIDLLAAHRDEHGDGPVWLPAIPEGDWVGSVILDEDGDCRLLGEDGAAGIGR